MSIPCFKKPYGVLKDLVQKMEDVSLKPEKLKSENENIFWIMTPSFQRHSKARLNLQHTMLGPDDNPIPYIHVVFVRDDEFELYRNKWKHSHAIVSLPNKDPDIDATVDSGGIGFARRFILKFAQELCIPAYLQNDDNIRKYQTYEVDKQNILIRNQDQSLHRKDTTLGEILKTLSDNR